MRKLVLSLGLLAGVASTAAAQQPMPWASEIGITLNYTMSSAGDADFTTIGIPSGNGIAGLGGIGGVYGVFPVNGRFAIEPSLGFQDISAGTTVTSANASVRVLYSAWRGLYVGAGPTLALFRIGGDQTSAFGAQVGVGYRKQLSGALQGRAELYYAYQGEHDLVPDETTTSMGLMIGLGLVPSAVPSARRGEAQGLWQWAMGIQGGYAHVSADGGDLTSFALPGGQQSILATGGAQPLPGVAPIFVQIPVGERFALEPSVGYSSIDVDGSTNVSAYALGLRANYAFNKTLYAAVSGDYQGFGGDLDIDGTTGFGVAGGVRFPLVMGLNGRTEISWRKFSADAASFTGEEYTITGLTFAVTAPIK
jgi:hypothetical protein